MLALLESGDNADVTFTVGNTTTPFLHTRLSSKLMHLFFTAFALSGVKRLFVSIKDTAPEVFRIILRYIYLGGDASEVIDRLRDFDELGNDVIEAANRYGIVGLKLAVETALVEQCVVEMRVSLTGSCLLMQRLPPAQRIRHKLLCGSCCGYP